MHPSAAAGPAPQYQSEIATTDQGPQPSVTDALQEFVDSHPDKIALVDETGHSRHQPDWAEEAADHGYADYRRAETISRS